MGTIILRKRKYGSTGYHAQVITKRGGKIVHRESRTFDRKQAASAWLEKREKELAKPGALERQKTPDPILGQVIDRYTTEFIKEIGRTKAQVLRTIKNYDIANKLCSEITSADIVAFANQLVAKMKPQTVANYLSHLAAVFAIARPAWGVNQQAIGGLTHIWCNLGIQPGDSRRNHHMANFIDPASLVPPGFVVDEIVESPDKWTARMHAAAHSANCPCCGCPSTNVHSHYRRTLADLPFSGRRVHLEIAARKFRCTISDCKQRSLSNDLPMAWSR